MPSLHRSLKHKGSIELHRYLHEAQDQLRGHIFILYHLNIVELNLCMPTCTRVYPKVSGLS
jgi:hypothetical protein